jgi:hypothetical protein
LFDHVNEISNIVDIISEEQASTERNYDNKECLNKIARMKIAKANSKNDSCTKVVAPDVLFIPRR